MRVRKIEECYLANGKAAYSNFGGTILVNKNVFSQLTANERTFILLHEAGHIELLTTDENKADGYAFFEYVKLGLPASEILTVMNKVLTSTPQNAERVEMMKKRIDLYNNKINGMDGAGDWLTLIGQVFGVAGQAAGGTSTEEQISIQEAKQESAEIERRKNTSYILAGIALIAIVGISILIFNKAKK